VGRTTKFKFGSDEHAYYITINNAIETDGTKRPYEIFINTKNVEHDMWIRALSRMVSSIFRYHHNPSFVAEELKQVHDPRGGSWSEGKLIPSIVAKIGGVIDDHIKQLKKDNEVITSQKPVFIPTVFIPTTPNHSTAISMKQSDINSSLSSGVSSNTVAGKLCPKCSEYSLVRSEGCDKCLSCTYSKCG
jgi:ribonucleoside-diphosphate reductase alpha chain